MSASDKSDRTDVEIIRAELAKEPPSASSRALRKFFLAALGSIPWFGGFLSAAASFKLEDSDIARESFQNSWLEEHQQKLERLLADLNRIGLRLDSLGDEITQRVESEEYLGLVRKAFRTWDKADTEEKRRYVANLITNAAGTRLCSDDVVRLFIEWLEQYHELHFAVIRHIYKNPLATRYDIWKSIYDEIPAEDSAEADLFRLLIRDLSTGGVVRQDRETTASGEFLRRPSGRRRGPRPATLDSSFDDEKPYVLTELGSQFVHYAMTDAVARLDASEAT